MTARAISIGGAIIVLDQMSKYVAMRYLPQIVNHGFSFGVGQGIGVWMLVFLLAVVVLDAARHGLNVSDVFIIAGGGSNILDRFLHGGVVDWIHVNLLWFNIADISITIGVTWIALTVMTRQRKAM